MGEEGGGLLIFNDHQHKPDRNTIWDKFLNDLAKKGLIDSAKTTKKFAGKKLRTQVSQISLRRNENWNPKTDVNFWLLKSFLFYSEVKKSFLLRNNEWKMPGFFLASKIIKFSAIKVQNNKSLVFHCYFSDGCPWNIIYLFYNLRIVRFNWKTHSLHFQRLRSLLSTWTIRFVNDRK